MKVQGSTRRRPQAILELGGLGQPVDSQFTFLHREIGEVLLQDGPKVLKVGDLLIHGDGGPRPGFGDNVHVAMGKPRLHANKSSDSNDSDNDQTDKDDLYTSSHVSPLPQIIHDSTTYICIHLGMNRDTP